MFIASDTPPHQWIETEDAARDLLRDCVEAPIVALDTETTGVVKMSSRVVIWSLAINRSRYALPEKLLPIFVPMFESEEIPKVLHNAKFDMHMVENTIGCRMRGPIFDTRVMAVMENTELSEYSLKFLSGDGLFDHKDPRHLDYDSPFGGRIKNAEDAIRERGLEEFANYASKDSWATLVIFNELSSRLKKTPGLGGQGSLWDIYVQEELDFTHALYGCERHGLLLDVEHLSTRAEAAEKRLNEIAEEFVYRAEKPINIRSRDQLAHFFYEVQRKPIRKRTSGGKSGNTKPSVDKEVLKGWAKEGDPFAKMLVEYREIDKILGTYLKGLTKLVDRHGRIHTTLNQGGTDTGRLCVHPDTRLETDLGTFCISDPALTDGRTYRILTHTGKWRRIQDVFRKGREEMFRVRTRGGREIICTAGHRFLTPQGWKSLSSIDKGGEIIAAWESPSRGNVHSAVSHREAFLEDSSGKVRRDAPNILRQSATLPTEVHRAFKKNKEFSTCACYVREQARGETAPGRYNREGGSEKEVAGRMEYSEDSQRRGVQRVLGLSEHRLPRLARRAERAATGIYRGPQHSFVGASRYVVPRIEGSCTTIQHRRHREVLPSTIPSLLKSTRDGLVHAEAWEGEGKILSYSRPVPDMLECESRRSHSVFGAGRRGAYVRSANSSGEEEGVLDGGLPSRRLVVRGSRWSIPRSPEGSRPQEGAINKEHREAASSSSFESCALGSWRSSPTNTEPFEVDNVETITSIGVCDVWDLTIEEDHSYVAQGFVNHNSSSEPNLQNIPRPGDVGDDYRIRESFIAPKGLVLVGADYDQLEMRIMAELSGETTMVDMINRGWDIHAANGAMMYNVPYEDIEEAKEDKKQLEKAGKKLTQRIITLLGYRQDAKTIGFGLNYGQGPAALGAKLGCTVDEAKEKIARYFEPFPNIQQFIRDTHDHVHRAGSVRTFSGRKRDLSAGMNFADRMKQSRAERQSVNSIIQGTAADIARLAMVHAYRSKKLKDLGATMLLQIHDELLFEAPEEVGEEVAEVVKEVMQMPYKEQFSVEITAQPATGSKWTDVH